MDLFELQASLRLNTQDFNKGLSASEKQAQGFMDKLADKWTSAKGKFQTASTLLRPVVNLISDAVGLYADFQQAEGGVRTLFGKSADKIIENAKGAWKTAGLAMNDYMSIVMTTGAKMLSDLGGDTERAADLANQAIIDMADNVNAFGTDMNSIMSAYSGFSRGVFTMLDNLHLGYGGTKEEMERLLKDAKELSGLDFDIASYADIVSAIHIIQENMGVGGTTAREAEGTISGSVAGLKALWENIKTIMATPAQKKEGETDAQAEARRQEEISEAVENLAKQLDLVITNVMPVIKTAIMGLVKVISELLPQIMEYVPQWLQMIVEALPDIISAIADGLAAIITDPRLKDGLNKIIHILLDAIVDLIGNEQIWASLSNLIESVIVAMTEHSGQMVNSLVHFIVMIFEHPELIGAIIKALAFGVVSGLAGVVDLLLTLLINIFNPGYSKNGTAFEQLGVYGWLEEAFGYKNPEGESTIPMKRFEFREEDEEKLDAMAAARARQEAETRWTKDVSFKDAVQQFKDAFGESANASIDPQTGMVSIMRDGWETYTAANTSEAIRYMMEMLESEGKLKTGEEGGGAAPAGPNVWNRNGEDIELPEGVTENMAKNFVSAMAMYAEGYEAKDFSNETVRKILAQYGDLIKQQYGDGLDVETPKMVVNGKQVDLVNSEIHINLGFKPTGGMSIEDQMYEWLEDQESHAKGLWSVPYDNYLANLHRDEMVLTASQAREYRNGGFGGGADIADAINSLRNDLANLKLVVGERMFGSAVVDYSGRRMQGYIGQAEDRLISGYGWG